MLLKHLTITFLAIQFLISPMAIMAINELTEHGGEEHAGSSAKEISAKQIKDAMLKHIKSNVKQNNGIFKIKDTMTGKTLKLKFIKIHDPVRKIKGKGYFACTDFQVAGASSTKLYDLDFWLNLKNGKLVVTETRIHKHPVKRKGKWVKKARYTFMNDKPVIIK